MSYTFKGTLCGLFCDECEELLANVTVRLYRHAPGANVTALAVAEVPTILSRCSPTIKSLRESFAADCRTQTDAEGAFIFTLAREQNYNGEAFEIDVYCGNVPHHIPGRRPPQPRQFSITTLQPSWKAAGEGDLSRFGATASPSASGATSAACLTPGLSAVV